MRLLVIASFFSCHQEQPKKSLPVTIDSANIAEPFSSNSYATQIVEGKIKPSDNDSTFACLDSLMSDNKATRAYYLTVFRVICKNADGALAEATGSFLKTYFELYSSEVLDYYSSLSASEKNLFIDLLAFEFYASGISYKEDLNTYFTIIRKPLSGKTHYLDIAYTIQELVTRKVALANE